MGGSGSGAHYHWWRPTKKRTVEGCLELDANRWMREGVLKAGAFRRGNWQWIYHGGDKASIGYQADLARQGHESVTLFYSVGKDAEARSLRYLVALTSTVPQFGGLRWWFLCPLRNCGRRVGKLYLPGGAHYFGCRHCHDLTYTSSQEAHQGDAGLGRIAARLGYSLEEVKRVLRRP